MRNILQSMLYGQGYVEVGNEVNFLNNPTASLALQQTPPIQIALANFGMPITDGHHTYPKLCSRS